MALLQAVHAVRAIFIFACVTTIHGANNIDCNFDDGTLCDWVQDRTDWFDWSNTGPGAPHTNPMSPGGGNAYAAMTPSLHLGSTARIISPYINMTDGSIRCLSLYFNRNAFQTGSLLVYQSDSTGSVKRHIMFSRDEPGYEWHYLDGEVRPTGNTRFQIVIEATKGPGVGDIGIDNVLLTPGYCPASTTTTPNATTATITKIDQNTTIGPTVNYHITTGSTVDLQQTTPSAKPLSYYDCSFDTICHWNRNFSISDWSFHIGLTSVGPTWDHTTGSSFGQYLYAYYTSDHRSLTAVTDLTSPVIISDNNTLTACLSFWYYLRGRMEVLLVVIQQHERSGILSTDTSFITPDTFESHWHMANVIIDVSSPVTVVIRSILQPGQTTPILSVVDDVRLTSGTCPATGSEIIG